MVIKKFLPVLCMMSVSFTFFIANSWQAGMTTKSPTK